MSRVESIRGCGRVIAFAETGPDTDAFAIAAKYGLSADESIYSVISAARAVEIIRAAMQRDLAYGARLLPYGQADHLARQVFLELFAGCEVFYSNVMAGPVLSQWSAATGATFDAGVLGVGPGNVGCIWFLDED